MSAEEREDSEGIRVWHYPGPDADCRYRTGTDGAANLPQVLLSIVEAMSHVLIESLARGEVDLILCYDVPDLPQFSRTALLQDDLVLVTQP